MLLFLSETLLDFSDSETEILPDFSEPRPDFSDSETEILPDFSEPRPDFSDFETEILPDSDSDSDSNSPFVDYAAYDSDSDQELPSITAPTELDESLLPDPVPVNAHSEPTLIPYDFGTSKRGARQLISSDSYSYNILRTNKNGDIKWQCIVRNSSVKCYSCVTQTTENRYTRDSKPHVHPPVPGAIQKNKMKIEGIQAAIANSYQSGIAIAKNLQRQIDPTATPTSADSVNGKSLQPT